MNTRPLLYAQSLPIARGFFLALPLLWVSLPLDAATIATNRFPVFWGSDGTSPFTIEHPENRTFVLRAKAYDPDRDALMFRLVGGADLSHFSIGLTTGILNFNTAPDWDLPVDQDSDNGYEVVVEADDGKGGRTSQAFLIWVQDSGDNVAPEFAGDGGALSVALPENTTHVAQLLAVDPDNDPLLYQISGGEDAALFSVGSETGELSFLQAPDWDQPLDLRRDNIYKVRVSVTDGRGGTDYQDVVATVENTFDNWPPVLTPPGNVTLEVIEQQTKTKDVIYRVFATDPDSDVLSFSISGGADSALFNVNGTTGELFFVSPRSIAHPEGSEEGGNVYVVEVRVDDGHDGTALQTTRVRIVEDLDPSAPYTGWVSAIHGIADDVLDPTWTPSYGTGDWPRVLRGVSTDLQEGLYVSGSFFGRIWLGESELQSAGFSDILAAHLDEWGKPVWVRRFGSRGTDIAPDIATDSQGSALMTGMCSNGSDFDGFQVTTLGGSDACTAKLASDGAVLWVRTVGGAETDSGNEVCTDVADNVLVVGNTEGEVVAGQTRLLHKGGMDSFVLKYDSDGGLLWARGISGGADEQGRGIATDPDGNVAVVGEFSGTIQLGSLSLTAASDQRDIFVAKYDPQGLLLWARRYGAAGEDFARGVGIDAQGYIYVTGVFSDKVPFGQTTLQAESNREQLFLMRLTPDGETDWAQGMTGPGQGHGCEIEVAADGDSVIACDILGELQIGDRTITSLGIREGIVARFSADGSLLWVKTLGATDASASFAIALDPNSDLVTTVGAFSGTIGNNGYSLTSVPDSSSYIIRLDSSLYERGDAIDDLSTYTLAADGPYSVEEIVLTLPADGWPEPIPLRLYVPTGSGPFPVVFFVSGSSGTNDTFPETSRYLASHGYLVLHNSYDSDVPMLEEDRTRFRVEGVKFVLDSLDTIARINPALAGKFDSQAVGAMGHSSGAYITQLLGGSIVIWNGIPESFYDPRVQAFIMYSGQGSDQQGLTTSSWDDLAVPNMQMSGTEDFGAYDQDPSWRREPFLFSPPDDKYLAWYYGGHHGSFSGKFLTDPLAQERFEHAKVMTLAFWDAYLKQSIEAKEFLLSDAPTSLAVTPLDFLAK